MVIAASLNSVAGPVAMPSARSGARGNSSPDGRGRSQAGAVGCKRRLAPRGRAEALNSRQESLCKRGSGALPEEQVQHATRLRANHRASRNTDRGHCASIVFGTPTTCTPSSGRLATKLRRESSERLSLKCLI
jgi:hypothetical protein